MLPVLYCMCIICEIHIHVIFISSRMLIKSIQDIKVSLQSHSSGFILPPQAPLHGWVKRGQALAGQSITLLQQLVWLLQCCPAESQQKEETSSCKQHTLRCLSPLVPQRQPSGCLMRRGDVLWCQLQQCVTALLKQTESLKVKLDSVADESPKSVLYTW